MEPKPEYLGTRIRDARKQCNLTQQELAAQTKVSIKTIQDIETGRGNPTYSTLVRLIDRLGIPVERLFGTCYDVEDEALQHFIARFLSCSKENQKVLLTTMDSLLESLLKNQDSMC